jgi:hypothetical protein
VNWVNYKYRAGQSDYNNATRSIIVCYSRIVVSKITLDIQKWKIGITKIVTSRLCCFDFCGQTFYGWEL